MITFESVREFSDYVNNELNYKHTSIKQHSAWVCKVKPGTNVQTATGVVVSTKVNNILVYTGVNEYALINEATAEKWFGTSKNLTNEWVKVQSKLYQPLEVRALFIPVQYKGIAINMPELNAEGIEHGKGDFILLGRDKHGKVKRRVVNGIAFGHMYDNRGWVDCLDADKVAKAVADKPSISYENVTNAKVLSVELPEGTIKLKSKCVTTISKGAYDELEVACFDLFKSYLAAMNIKLVSIDEDDEAVDFAVAKEIQDAVLGVIQDLISKKKSTKNSSIVEVTDAKPMCGNRGIELTCDDTVKLMPLSSAEKIAKSVKYYYCYEDIVGYLMEHNYKHTVFRNKDLIQAMTEDYYRNREEADGGDTDCIKDWTECLNETIDKFKAELNNYLR